jgi:hypothetical protein
MIRRLLILFLAGFLLPGAVAVRAETGYRIEVVARAGEAASPEAGGGHAWIGSRLFPGTLNDHGQILFASEWGNGNQELLLAAGGEILPVVAAGGEAPGGRWRSLLRLAQPGSMNQRGSAALAVGQPDAGGLRWGATFRWDFTSRSTVPVAREGMPAVYGLSFLPGDQASTPAINNRDEIAFAGFIPDDAGRPRRAFFLAEPDGALRLIALPEQLAHLGETIQPFGSLSVTDQGVVVFQAWRKGDPPRALSAYEWENGFLTPVVTVGALAPDGSKVTRVTGVRAGNRSRLALVAAHVSTHPDQAGLFFAAHGQLKPAAVPGQTMPGGDRLRTVQETIGSAGPSAAFHVSRANEAGQYAFVALLEDGHQGVYRVDEDGTLSLVLKSGTDTAVGRIIAISRDGYGIGLNSRGQVAVAVQIQGGPDVLVRLTPEERPSVRP